MVLSNLSGGACQLYLYLGLHSKNLTGESFYDVKTMAKFFGKTSRTIQDWLDELQKKGLIYRTKVKYGGVTYTYLLPYGEKATPYLESIDRKMEEIEKNSEEEEDDD